jgi:hypothetical protein
MPAIAVRLDRRAGDTSLAFRHSGADTTPGLNDERELARTGVAPTRGFSARHDDPLAEPSAARAGSWIRPLAVAAE